MIISSTNPSIKVRAVSTTLVEDVFIPHDTVELKLFQLKPSWIANYLNHLKGEKSSRKM